MRTVILCSWLIASSLGLARADAPATQEHSPYVAPEDRALLVLVRSRTRLAEEVPFSVLDERGECVGILGNDWKIALPLRPGPQTLMLVTGVAQPQVQLLRVKPTAGKTYVVRLRPRVDRKAPIEIAVVRRRDQPLEAFPGSILESSPFRPDLDECTAWARSRRSKLAKKAADAKREWNAEEALRASQTVRAGDGWPADEIVP